MTQSMIDQLYKDVQWWSSRELAAQLATCRSRERYRHIVLAAKSEGLGLPRDLAGRQPKLILPPHMEGITKCLEW